MCFCLPKVLQIFAQFSHYFWADLFNRRKSLIATFISALTMMDF